MGKKKMAAILTKYFICILGAHALMCARYEVSVIKPLACKQLPHTTPPPTDYDT